MVAAACAGALVFRVWPSWPIVFSPVGVNFQDGDAFYHVRTMQSLVAQFPFRSSFDPYALHPGGQRVVTGPFWDYLCATTAWLIGLGRPRVETVEIIAAWMPALFGALLPALGFWLVRRQTNAIAGVHAAWWMATMPGALLWITHLGLADHHAAESVLSLAVLLCAVAEWPVATGVALGLFLMNRPAAIFVPGLLTLGVMARPESGTWMTRASLVAALVFAPGGFAHQSELAWMALAGLALVSFTARWERRWWAWLAMLAAGLALVAIWRPQLLNLGRYFFPTQGIEAKVQELTPLLRSQQAPPLATLFLQLGTAWILAAPALLWMIWKAVREPRWRLPALWCAVMILGTFAQTRMAAYGAVAIALLAGGASAWMAARWRWTLAVSALMVLAPVPDGLAQLAIDAGPTRDMRMALGWLRTHTPEPGGYGVLAPWDRGYWIQYLGQRAPITNGTQTRAREVAEAYFATDPAKLRELGARYVMADPMMALFDGPAALRFGALAETAGHRVSRFRHILVDDPDGAQRLVPAYLPAYYRSMAAHLFLHDGGRAPGDRVMVWTVKPWKPDRDAIVDQQSFATEAEAEAYIRSRPAQRHVLGCPDPGVSCLPLEPLPGVRRLYSSDPLPIARERRVRAVKVFEVTR